MTSIIYARTFSFSVSTNPNFVAGGLRSVRIRLIMAQLLYRYAMIMGIQRMLATGLSKSELDAVTY